MSADTLSIALLGFSELERHALVSYLHLTDTRSPRYTHVLSVDEADFVLADSDQTGVLALLQKLGRVGDTIFVGAEPPAGAAGWLMHPVNPQSVLRELDALTARRRDGERTSGFAPLSDFDRGELTQAGAWPSRPMRVEPATPADQRRRADLPPTRPRAAVAPAGARVVAREADAEAGAASATRVLIVDDSDLARHFLARELSRYGLHADAVATSDEALALLVERPYAMVFLDVELGPASHLDGFALCHRIRHLPLAPGASPPTVVIVSAFHDAVDRVRGTLAGAEQMLGKPLDFPALEQLMRRHGHHRVGAASAAARAAPTRD